MILEVDPSKRRVSLGLKQTMRNPWEEFAEKHPVGSDRRGRGQEQDRVRPVPRPRGRRRRHGPPLRPRLEPSGRGGDGGLQEGRDGQGQGARRRRREGAHLARHQAGAAAIRSPKPSTRALRKNAIVTGEVTHQGWRHRGEDRRVPTSTAFIRRAELSRDRSEQRPERFAAGEKVDARVTTIDKKTRKMRCRSRRWRSPRRRRRWPSTARPIPAPRSATSSAPR